jgi:hypothetical protein
MSLTFDTTVFSDPQGEALARVYVVAAPTAALPDDELAALQINGRLVGPTCRYSSTLQASIPLKHRGLTRWGDRTAIVAEAVVPDPCYWSTDLPFLYRAVGEVTGPRTSLSPSAFEQPFGIRSLGTSGKRLTFNGRPWVPRIVHRVEVTESPPATVWRDAAAAMFVDRPDDELCRELSEAGVLLMTTVEGDRATVLAELSRLGRYPAVGIVVVKSTDTTPRELRTAAQNTLLARFSDRKFDASVGDQADVLLAMVLADGSEWGLKWAVASELPMLVMRPLDRIVPLAEARAACDVLQSDLAGKHEAAGYLV